MEWQVSKNQFTVWILSLLIHHKYQLLIKCFMLVECLHSIKNKWIYTIFSWIKTKPLSKSELARNKLQWQWFTLCQLPMSAITNRLLPNKANKKQSKTVKKTKAIAKMWTQELTKTTNSHYITSRCLRPLSVSPACCDCARPHWRPQK